MAPPTPDAAVDRQLQLLLEQDTLTPAMMTTDTQNRAPRWAPVKRRPRRPDRLAAAGTPTDHCLRRGGNEQGHTPSQIVGPHGRTHGLCVPVMSC